MISRMRACDPLCVWLHRVYEQLECQENACAGHGCLARPSALAAVSCAAHVWHVTIEGSPSYVNILLLLLLLLVLLLLLLLARLSLQRHLCCCRRYLVVTPLATRAQCLRLSSMKPRRTFLRPLLQMRPEHLQIYQQSRCHSIHRRRCCRSSHRKPPLSLRLLPL